jgi:hypothetical protein
MKRGAEFGEHEEDEETQSMEGPEGTQDREQFSATESEPDSEELERMAMEQDPERKNLIANINRLANRYPSVKLRSTADCLAQLGHLDNQQLASVFDNQCADVTRVRGTPVAKAILLPLKKVPQDVVPKYYERCKDDEELKLDIETVVVSYVGLLGPVANIACHLITNAADCIEEGGYEPPPKTPVPGGSDTRVEDRHIEVIGGDEDDSHEADGHRKKSKKSKKGKEPARDKRKGKKSKK